MKRLLAIFLSVAVMAAVLCVPVSASSPRGISDFWQRLKFAWGCSDATGVICADCHETTTFEQLNKSDYCTGCGALLINRFGGFGGGSSRGGGAGRDGTPVVSSSGSMIDYATPVLGSDASEDLYKLDGDSAVILTLPAGNKEYSVYASSYYWSSSSYDLVNWYYKPVVDGSYKFSFEYSPASSNFIFSGGSSKSLNLVGGLYVCAIGSRSFDSLGVSRFQSKATYVNGVSYYYGNTFYVRCKVTYSGGDFSPSSDDSNIDAGTKNLIINESTTVSYTNIYDYGDTYITYDVNNHPTVFVRDDNGQIIGSMAWQDGAYNLQYYNGFSPSVSTGSDSGSDSGSGSGSGSDSGSDSGSGSGSGSDSGSGSGSGSGSDPGSDSGDGILGWIMKKIVAAIEGIFKTIGDLIGAVFLGILELIQSVLDNLTQSISLVDGFSDSIASVFDFLPDKYRSILLAGFSCFMLISIFKFMRG